MRLMDHVTLNFNSNVSTATVFLDNLSTATVFLDNVSTAIVFLDIEKAFDTTWHFGLLYKLLELQFLIILIKLISTFLSQRKFRFSVESEMFMPMDIKAGVPQGLFVVPTLYSIYCIYVYK
jgi:hypothetical protein